MVSDILIAGEEGGGEGRRGIGKGIPGVVCVHQSAVWGTDLNVASLLVQGIPKPSTDHLHDNALFKREQASHVMPGKVP